MMNGNNTERALWAICGLVKKIYEKLDSSNEKSVNPNVSNKQEGETMYGKDLSVPRLLDEAKGYTLYFKNKNAKYYGELQSIHKTKASGLTKRQVVLEHKLGDNSIIHKVNFDRYDFVSVQHDLKLIIFKIIE